MPEGFMNVKNLFLSTAAVVLFVLFLFNPETVKASATEALADCAVKVMPAIFPFTVLSGIAVGVFSRLDCPRFPRIFVYLLGALCGFPIGAVCTAGLYESGVISKKDAEILAGICNNTGPAFVIGVVGIGIWKSKTVGIIIYVIQIISSLICAAVFLRKRAVISPLLRKKYSSNGNIITSSVSRGASTSLKICGYVVFFRVLSQTLIPSFFPVGLKALFASLLECTAGASLGGSLGGVFGFALTAFAVSFSGISVLLQSADVLGEAGLSVKYTVIEKSVQGVIAGVFSLIFAILYT